jgi:multiple sugar transport system substrate-binding protein
MTSLSRRSVLRASMGLTATGGLARPHIANAQSTTATLWAGQGFIQPEDTALIKTIAEYEKASGNKIERLIMPFQAMNQKTVAALTSGDVPDLFFQDAPTSILPQNAWGDKLVDMSDVVERQKSRLSESALQCASFYNGAKKERSFYLAPIKQGCTPFHIWGDLVEKAGYKLSDAPNTWDAYWISSSQCKSPCARKQSGRSMHSAFQ